MRLNKLYVEGKLDTEIYTALFGGQPTVVRGGSKYGLKPRARNDREYELLAGYLRDRDFDFDPPTNLDKPTVDASDNGDDWGWRLNRHEIENYLIDPRVVNAALGIALVDWQVKLREAAHRIRSYQVARWTIGFVRSKLPPNYKLETRPDNIGEMRLPTDLSETASMNWCKSCISRFKDSILVQLNDDTLETQIVRKQAVFSDEKLQNLDHILCWCSGKDLFAGLDEDSLQLTQSQSLQELCNRLRDWVMKNPESFVSYYPEFRVLREQMRS